MFEFDIKKSDIKISESTFFFLGCLIKARVMIETLDVESSV